MNKLAGTPVNQSQSIASIVSSRLECLVEELTTTVANMHERLSPILHPEEPTAEEKRIATGYPRYFERIDNDLDRLSECLQLLYAIDRRLCI
jgi:hypothetical protein